MYRFSLVLLFISVLLISNSSCGDQQPVERYLLINGKRHLIHQAVVDYLPHDENLDYQRIALKFSSVINKQETFLTGLFYVPLNTKDNFGRYSYSYTPEPGKLSHVLLGQSVAYDEHGEKLAGKIIAEADAQIDGLIRMTEVRGKMVFEIDLKIQTAKEHISVSGAYSDKLETGYVYY